MLTRYANLVESTSSLSPIIKLIIDLQNFSYLKQIGLSLCDISLEYGKKEPFMYNKKIFIIQTIGEILVILTNYNDVNNFKIYYIFLYYYV